jgi:hypothetical protein
VRLKLFTSEIEDKYIQENFRKIVKFWDGQPILTGDFKLFEFTIIGNVSNFKFKHNLPFTPKDVIQTSVIFSAGVGTLTWNYAKFTDEFIDLTTASMGSSDTCTIRALVGRFL